MFNLNIMFYKSISVFIIIKKKLKNDDMKISWCYNMITFSYNNLITP